MSREIYPSKKKRREVERQLHPSNKKKLDELLRLIGGHILEHGTFRVEKDLANLSQGMKIKVVDEGTHITMFLIEADGGVYKVPENTDDSRLSGDGKDAGVSGSGDTGTRSEGDVRGYVREVQPERTGEATED